jgi:hypothetical protein
MDRCGLCGVEHAAVLEVFASRSDALQCRLRDAVAWKCLCWVGPVLQQQLNNLDVVVEYSRVEQRLAVRIAR